MNKQNKNQDVEIDLECMLDSDDNCNTKEYKEFLKNKPEEKICEEIK